MSFNAWTLRLPKLGSNSQLQRVKRLARSARLQQILSLEAQLTGLLEQQRNLTLKAQQPEVFNLSVGQEV